MDIDTLQNQFFYNRIILKPLVFIIPADTETMDISSVNSMSDTLASMASSMTGGNLQAQISTAVLKQAMQQQQIMADGLLKMINATASLSGTGKVVDILA